MEIYVKDQEDLDGKVSRMSESGAEGLHVLADFDKTFTKSFVKGKHVSSLISILRDEGHLTKEYPNKAKKLADEYYPIEIDHSIPIEKKSRLMEEWWIKHFKLLIESGLNKRDIENSVKSDNIVFREGVGDFLKYLENDDVPVVFVSSSGLGVYSVSLALKRDNLFHNNIYVISNDFEWDENGNAVDYRKPVIHVFNKDETVLESFPEIYSKIKDGKNVLLLGDSLGDLGMIEGFDYDNLISVGFYNEVDEKGLEEYKEKFDVVITGDGDFGYVNGLLEKILNLKSK
jgi:5'-nucleotidase